MSIEEVGHLRARREPSRLSIPTGGKDHPDQTALKVVGTRTRVSLPGLGEQFISQTPVSRRSQHLFDRQRHPALDRVANRGSGHTTDDLARVANLRLGGGEVGESGAFDMQQSQVPFQIDRHYRRLDGSQTGSNPDRLRLRHQVRHCDDQPIGNGDTRTDPIWGKPAAGDLQSDRPPPRIDRHRPTPSGYEEQGPHPDRQCTPERRRLPNRHQDSIPARHRPPNSCKVPDFTFRLREDGWRRGTKNPANLERDDPDRETRAAKPRMVRRRPHPAGSCICSTGSAD